jgi:hypothetical protein
VLLNYPLSGKIVGKKLPCAFYVIFNEETKIIVENPFHGGEFREEHCYITESGST